MRTVTFSENNFYHIFNRGIDHRKIFLDENDYRRFYTSLFLFNDRLYHAEMGVTAFTLRGDIVQREQEPIVRILSFCLIPNHFHFLLEPLSDTGLTQFMHRLLMGYAKYFNKKYERKGPLYEGNFKAVPIERDAHFEHLLRYIHLNALDATNIPWREGKVTDWAAAEKFLENHRWSSHHVYNGKGQRLPVVAPGVLGEMFKTPVQYMELLKEWSERECETKRSITPW
jgi:putative transposase